MAFYNFREVLATEGAESVFRPIALFPDSCTFCASCVAIAWSEVGLTLPDITDLADNHILVFDLLEFLVSFRKGDSVPFLLGGHGVGTYYLKIRVLGARSHLHLYQGFLSGSLGCLGITSGCSSDCSILLLLLVFFKRSSYHLG